MAFSRDGARLASASYDKTVRIWSVADRKEIVTLKGHTNAVLAVAFLPDGRTLVTGGADRLVKVWDVDAKKEIGSHGDHRGAVRGIAVSPDGKKVATAGSDRRINLWETGGWTLAGSLRGHGGPVRAVAFSPDGLLIASTAEDGMAFLWDANTREIRHRLAGHDGAVTGIAFSPRGQIVATSGSDKSLRLWETGTGGELANLEDGHAESIQGVAFAPSGRQIATAAADKSVGVWSATLPPMFATHSLNGRPGWTGVAAVSPDGKRIAVVGEKYAIVILDADSGAVLTTLRGHRATVTQLAFSRDGARLLSAGRDRVGYLWDVQGSRSLATLDGHRGVVRAVAFSPDGKAFATGGSDKRILMYDLPPADAGPGELRERAVLEGHHGTIACLVFSPDGRRLASGTETVTKTGPAEVKLWDVASGAEVAGWADHTGDVTALTFHPTRSILVSAGADPGFRVRDLATLKPVLFRKTQTALTAAAFTAGGSELLTGSAGQALLAWDVDGLARTGPVRRPCRRGHRAFSDVGITGAGHILDRGGPIDASLVAGPVQCRRRPHGRPRKLGHLAGSDARRQKTRFRQPGRHRPRLGCRDGQATIAARGPRIQDLRRGGQPGRQASRVSRRQRRSICLEPGRR